MSQVAVFPLIFRKKIASTSFPLLHDDLPFLILLFEYYSVKSTKCEAPHSTKCEALHSTKSRKAC